MPWLELRIHTDKTQVSEYEETLEKSDALAVTYADAGDQPILEPEAGSMPLWKNVVVIGLFDAAVDTNRVETSIRDVDPTASLRWDILEDKIWEREWLKHHQPQKFGNAFWVYHEPVEDDLSTLLLDPGLAFGTGTHPTTALCLEWISQRSLRDKTVVDFGCGSGILAVASILRGAKSAICVDLDAQALQATRKNAQRNHISDEQLKVYFPNNEPKNLSDILIANILAKPLMQLANSFATKISAGGSMCLSGILVGQEAEIVEQYQPWFDSIQTECVDDWVRISGVRNRQLAARESIVLEMQAS